MRSPALNKFKICSWNINGWTDANSCIRKGIIDIINPDILCLNETHLSGSESINIEKYTFYGFNRPFKHVKAPKASGGVGILVNDSMLLNYDVQTIDKTIDGIICLELNHKFTDHRVTLVCAYLPPKNSS